jgi:hypothetical protein
MQGFPAILCGLFVVAAYWGFWFTVFRKAGYEAKISVFMAIGMFIPLVNLCLAVYFATTVWPIQTTLSTMRGEAGLGTQSDAYDALSSATRLESYGDAAGAIAKYEEIMRRFPGSEAAHDAEVSVRSLKAKISGA